MVYRKPTHTDQYVHYISHHQTSFKESVVSSFFNRAYSIITNKDDSHKENARIKQVLTENGYQESNISKIFKRITNNNSLLQSQQLTQATDMQEEEIRMSINLLYFEGTSEKLWRVLGSHKIRSTFYTEKTFHKLLFVKLKIEQLKKIKTKWFMILTVVTVKQSTSVNLNVLQNRVQMSTKDLSGIAIVIRMRLLNTAGKQITTLIGIRRKLLIGKAG